MAYKELISKLKKETYWLGGSEPYSRDIHPKVCDEAADAISELLERAEAAEKQLAECKPVVRAHWVRHYYDSGKQIDDNWYCSQCAMCGGKVQLCYCPNCGAKMDEEKPENG